jgi:hypothetical protein
METSELRPSGSTIRYSPTMSPLGVASGQPEATARGSKRHRHEETLDARLAAAPAAVYARRSIFIPIENPIITVLARERQRDGDRPKIAVYAIVVAVPVNLVRRQMMRVRWTAARSFHPVRDRAAVCPLVVSACRESGQRSEDRNQTPHDVSLAVLWSNLTLTRESPPINNRAQP